MERETRLREGEEIDQGSGSTGPKEERRANMVELLRRIRRGEREGDTGGGIGSSSHENGSGTVGVSQDEAQEGDGELDIQQDRLEALALALKDGGHALRTQLARAKSSDAVGVTVTPATKGVAPNSEGVRGPPSSSPRAESFGERGAMTDDDERILDLLTEEERGRFLREVASGRLGKLIVPWVPWWTQAAGVQEVTSMTAGGRTSHSLPPPVVDPSHHHTLCSRRSARSAGKDADGDGQVSSPPTRPATPEDQQQQQPSGFEVSSSSGDQVVEANGVTTGSPAGEGRHAAPAVVAEADDAGTSCTRHSFAALLSQAFRAPDFSTICAKQPSPTLPALATDLAYAYVLTSRLYNGCWCSDPVGASLTLVGASPVLRDGATPVTVGQALTACVERAVEGEAAGFRGYAESLRQVCFVPVSWVVLEFFMFARSRSCVCFESELLVALLHGVCSSCGREQQSEEPPCVGSMKHSSNMLSRLEDSSIASCPFACKFPPPSCSLNRATQALNRKRGFWHLFSEPPQPKHAIAHFGSGNFSQTQR